MFTAMLVSLLLTTLHAAVFSSTSASTTYKFPQGQKSYEYADFVCAHKPGSDAYDLEWSRMLNAVCLLAFLRAHQLAKEDGIIAHPTRKNKAVYRIGQARLLSKKHMLVVSSVIRTFVPSMTLFIAEAPIDAIAQRWSVAPFDVFASSVNPVLHITRATLDGFLAEDNITITTDKEKAVFVMSILERLPCLLKEGQPFGVFLVFDGNSQDGVVNDPAFDPEELLENVRFLAKDGCMSIEYTVGLPVAGHSFDTLLPEAPPPSISLPSVANFHYSRDRFGTLRNWNRMLASYYRHILYQMTPESDSSIAITLEAIQVGILALFPQSNVVLVSAPPSFLQNQVMRLLGDHIVLSDNMQGCIVLLSFHPSRPLADPKVLQTLNGIRAPNQMPSLLLHPPHTGTLRSLLLKSLESAIEFQEKLAIEATRALSLFYWGILLMLPLFCSSMPHIDWLTQLLPASRYVLFVDNLVKPAKLGAGYIVALDRQSGGAVRTACDIVVTGYKDDALEYVQITDSGDTFDHFCGVE